MVAGGDADLERLWPVLGAPHVGGTQPEHLLGRVIVETRKSGLGSVLLDPRLVGVVSLLDTTIVRDVFSLSIDSIQLWKRKCFFISIFNHY